MTSRVQTDPYQGLLKDKGGTGFPFLVFMDAEGNVLLPHNGARSMAGFEKTSKDVLSYLKAKAAAEKGDRSAKIDALLIEMDYGKTKQEDGETKLKELGELSADQTKYLEQIRFNGQVEAEVKGAGRDKTKVIAAGKRFLEWHKAGKGPTNDRFFDSFYIYILDFCESEKDAKTFEESLNILKKKYGDDAGAKRFFDAKNEVLKKLKEGK